MSEYPVLNGAGQVVIEYEKDPAYVAAPYDSSGDYPVLDGEGNVIIPGASVADPIESIASVVTYIDIGRHFDKLDMVGGDGTPAGSDGAACAGFEHAVAQAGWLDFEQTTGSQQPLYINDADGNGNAALRFDGIDDLMRATGLGVGTLTNPYMIDVIKFTHPDYLSIAIQEYGTGGRQLTWFVPTSATNIMRFQSRGASGLGVFNFSGFTAPTGNLNMWTTWRTAPRAWSRSRNKADQQNFTLLDASKYPDDYSILTTACIGAQGTVTAGQLHTAMDFHARVILEDPSAEDLATVQNTLMTRKGLT